MRRRVIQLYIKNNEVIFSWAWNIIFTDNYKVLVLNFLEMKNMVFLSQKVDGNMIFTDYWKVLALTFSEMGNTVFSWAKKLTEIWYLLITGKFLFWTFRWWEIRSFFQPKSWWKDDIYVVFLSFLWYSRTWKIWFFAQCKCWKGFRVDKWGPILNSLPYCFFPHVWDKGARSFWAITWEKKRR